MLQAFNFLFQIAPACPFSSIKQMQLHSKYFVIFNNNFLMVFHLEIIDYRNAKYQGQVKQTMHHGYGMLLKDDFTFIAGQWENNCLDGLAFIIYQNGLSFFGTFKKSKPHGLCFYNFPNQVLIYFKFQNGIPGPQLAIVMQNDHLILQGTVRKQKQLQAEFVQAITYKDREQRNRIVSSITKCTIKTEEINWINFLQHFQRTYPTLLQLVHMKRNKIKEICFGFKSIAGLGCCFNIDGQVLSLGFYNKEFVLKQIGRKFVKNFAQKEIQQGNYLDMDLVYIYDEEDSRPIQVNRIINQYFKQSVHFCNSFYNFQSIKQHAQIPALLSDKILTQMIQKYQEIQVQKQKMRTDRQQIKPTQEYTLLQVKKDIFAAINRKNQTSKSNLGTSQQHSRYSGLKQRSVEKFNRDPIIYDYSRQQNTYSRQQNTYSRTTQNFDYEKRQLDEMQRKLNCQIQRRNRIVNQSILPNIQRIQVKINSGQKQQRRLIAQMPSDLDIQILNQSKRNSFQDNSEQIINSFSFIREKKKKPKVKLSELTEIYKQIQEEIDKRQTSCKNKAKSRYKYNYQDDISPQRKSKIKNAKAYIYS